MRPKKTILCVDADEAELGRRRFLLETYGYRVLTATGPESALDVLAGDVSREIYLLVTDLYLGSLGQDVDGNDLVRHAKERHPGLPCMITSRTVSPVELTLHADVFLPRAANIPSELLERVRILVSRKRGPKKLLPPVWTGETQGAERAA